MYWLWLLKWKKILCLYPQLVLDKAAVNALSTKEGGTVADLVALEVGSIGENMAVRRAFLLQAQPGDHIGTYVHSAGKHLAR